MTAAVKLVEVSNCLLQSLAKQLHSEDVEVRAAAGEAIALLYHSCGIADLDSFLDDQNDSDTSPPSSPTGHVQPARDQTQAPTKPLRLSASSKQHVQGAIASQASAQDLAQDYKDQDGASEKVLMSSPALPSDPSCTTDDGSILNHLPAAHSTQDSCAQDCSDLSSETAGNTQPPSASAASASEVQMSHHRHEDSEHGCSGTSGYNEGRTHVSDSACISTGDVEDERTRQPTNGNANVSSSHNDARAHENDDQQQSHVLEGRDHADSPNGNLSHAIASPSPARKHNPTAEVISSGQQLAKSKEGHQGGTKSASRNPKQQAEAISNGLDDVVNHMKELASNRGDKSRRSRKDRAATRSTFRDLCNVVEVSLVHYKTLHAFAS